MKLRRLTVLWAILLATGGVAQTAAAQAASAVPSTREDVVHLFDVMHLKEQTRHTVELMAVQVREMTKQAVKRRHPDATDQELARVTAMSDDLLKNYPVEEMLDDIVPVYQKHLSKSDVEAMLGFYSSPTGQKLLQDQPAIVSESMQAMSGRMERLMDEMMDRVERDLKLNKPKEAAPKPAPKEKT
jgi:hypothetical protein